MPNKQRPIYMLIFNDLLRKHNQAQPKYEPPARQQTDADRPSVSFSNPSAPSVNPTATIESSAPLSASGTVVAAAGRQRLQQPQQQASWASSSAQSSDRSPSVSRSSNISSRKGVSNQSISQGSGSLAANRLFASSMAPKQTNRTPPPYQKPKAHKIIIRKTTKLAQPTFKDSAPSVSQTPVAVLGNSNSLPAERRRSPTPTPTPTPRPSPSSRSSHSSMAKTIAEHTPHGFKTLGPGFNARAPAEKSLNPTPGDGHSLSSTIVPSDYEHIYHAPSQISDLPGVDETSHQSTNNQTKRHKKHDRHHHTHGR